MELILCASFYDVEDSTVQISAVLDIAGVIHTDLLMCSFSPHPTLPLYIILWLLAGFEPVWCSG